MNTYPIWLIYLMVFCGGFLALQAFMGAGRQAAVKVKMANDRLRRMQTEETQADVVAKIRKSRSLTESGDLKGALIWLNNLVLQSGLRLGANNIYYILAGMAVSLGLMLFLLKGTLIWVGIGAISGLIIPILGLKFLVKRRRNKAVSQLPEALDVIVRSLSAGHPVPVAMALVAREMSDPIGSEFGIASDEVSFGSKVSTAIQRLSDRIGHDDFELFSAMIRLQERTGGNLAELLRANAKTTRDRQKMRLRIKACSAEGRMSAMILNIAPIALFMLIKFTSPDFYGDVSDSDLIKPAFIGVAIWMTIGNLVMRKMINFRI
ncbi:type II secretion system F family protein [Hellea balneolensis]|uniref:type II secretion system F family protein n=1 Tax=Hellea balneolensis TaxID=287478 RepID=UPI00047BCFAC|nr:type II secretion system F family protein [Hellea balneolensis]